MRTLSLLNIIVALCIGVQDIYAQWTLLPDNAHPNVSASFSNKDTGFVATGGKLVLRTTDAGYSWKSFSVTQDIHVVKALEDGIVFAGGGAIFKSANYGILWDSIYTQRRQFPVQTTYALSFTTVSNGVISGECDIEYTVNGGFTWNIAYIIVPSLVLSSFGLNSTVIYCGGRFNEYSLGTMMKTTDGGANWSHLMLNLPLYYAPQGVLAIHFFNERKGIVGGSKGGNKRSYAVLVTTDGGETWDTTKFVFPYTVNTIAFADSVRGFIGDAAGNIYSTTDGGTTWQNDNVPSNGRSINSIAIAGGVAVYAVGDGGLILKRDLPTNVNDAIEQQRFSMYPNPTSVTIRFRLGREYIGALVTIVDVLGRQMFTAEFNEQEFDVDMSTYRQGMYVVTMQRGSMMDSQMLMLVE